MIPELSDNELTAALGRTPSRRERSADAQTLWFGADRVLLADLAVPGVGTATIFEGLRAAAERTGQLTVVLDQPPIRAILLAAALPGSRQAVAADDSAVLTMVLPRSFPGQAANAAALLLVDALRR